MNESGGPAVQPEAGSGSGDLAAAASRASAASLDVQLAASSFMTAIDDEAAAAAEAPAASPPAAAEPGAEAAGPLRSLRCSADTSVASEPQLTDPKGTASSKLRRIQQRNDQLRRLFGLPATENLVEDFSCALKKKMLLQGRMYVFEEHICFYTNLFGYVKLKSIPLSEVTDVKKKKNVGFANSIEVTWGPNNKREFFTSFLHRGEAYRLIMSRWRQCSDLAPPSPLAPQPGDADGWVQASGLSGKTKRLLRGMGSLVSRSSFQHGSEDTGALRSSVSGTADSMAFLAGLPPPSGLDSLAEEVPGAGGGMALGAASSSGGEEAEVGAEPSFRSRRSGQSSFVVVNSSPGPAGSATTSSQSSPAKGQPRPWAGEAAAGEAAGGCGAGSSAAGSSGAGGSAPQYTLEFQSVSDQQLQKEVEAEISGSRDPAPPVDTAMQAVLDFELACTPLQFWCRFISNASDFLVRFHESRGDSAIRLGKWTRHYKVGLVRDLQFITPVKAKIGPPQAMCHQTQRLQVFAGQHLVLETSQVMSEIPYSDHFSVEVRWDVVPRGEGCCHVTTHAKVPFSKSTMWKKFIEKGSMDQLAESMQAYNQLATSHLAAEPLIARPASFTHHARRHTRGGSVSSATTAGVPVGRQSPALLSRHRRRASHVTDAMAAAAVEAAPSPRTVEEQKRQLAAAKEGPPRPALQRIALAMLAALAATFAWLAGRVAAAARAAWSHPGHLALCSIGCVIMALQVALLLEHRLQHQHVATPDAAAGTAAAIGGPEAAAQAAAALRREVANLQRTLQQLHMQGEAWQGQLQSALASAAELAQRLPAGADMG